MKKGRVGLMVLVAAVLAAGTIFEKYRGAEWVADHFYGSWWFAVLLGLVAIGSLTALRGKRKVEIGKQKSKFSIFNSQFSIYLIHAAIPIILLGGALTTWTGEYYSITLAPGETKEGITLESFEVLYYPGTHTPMDFVSHVVVSDESKGTDSLNSKFTIHDSQRHDISMNHILRHNGRRYYQEDYDDQGRTTLSVSHDPWGIPVTYTGYALLLLGLGWLCLQQLHSVSRLGRRVAPLLLLLIFTFQLSIFNSAQAAPRTLPRETASKMGEIYTLYKGRICPLQTYAKDYTTKLTGKATYKGLTSEQVLSGFLFYYSDWAMECETWKVKSEKRNEEKEAIVNMLLSGHGLKLFPIATDSIDSKFKIQNSQLSWYVQNDDLPVSISEDEYLFIRKHLGYCQELVVRGDYAALEQVFEKIKLFQEKRAADILPSPTRVRAERIYNALTTGRWLAILTLTLGLFFFAYSLYNTASKRIRKFSIINYQLSILYLFLLTSYLLLVFILRWIAGGHIPMAGGFDSMNIMSMVIGIIGIVLSFRSRKFSIFNFQFSISIALLTMGFCLLVAMMSGSNPPVTNLMPVLNSPLLCLHVAVIMMSYALFFFLMMTSIAGLLSGKKTLNFQFSIFNLAKRLLYPAVFLLALGIIIGALWANISWGNYWTWDPKEVWALITLIVYALPMHPGLKIHPSGNQATKQSGNRAFFIYCTFAFLSVIITYFGVNLLLGGIHAYN